MIRENGNNWITKDRGSITYPLDGSVYENRKSCIWQIRPKTPNKYIKVTKLELIVFSKKIWPKTVYGHQNLNFLYRYKYLSNTCKS